ncbi:unnamed protein product [Citrullus colocynthis]|uniref:Uncharacterized protein n=1 Tax=Citrullus colocynthis TaxID=252529 RepID=A0ABP0XRF2_9ROSI
MGDKNSEWFHKKVLIRRQKILIEKIQKEDGQWTTNEQDQLMFVLQHVPCKVTPQMNEALLAPFPEEVKKTLFQTVEACLESLTVRRLQLQTNLKGFYRSAFLRIRARLSRAYDDQFEV